MAEEILTKTQLLTYNQQVSGNIGDDRINQVILDAQRLDLEPLLGRAFYYELWNALDDSPVLTKYSDLRDGTEYTDPNGYTIQFYGILPVIAYFSIARLRLEQDGFITRSGNKFKEREQSERIGYKTLEAQASADRSKALYYQESLLDYLEKNKATYPNWNNYSPKTERQSGFELFSINKSANNGTQNY